MKIYTRTGDDGTTGLLGAARVLKSAPRVEAYGAVDELNAHLGLVRSLPEAEWLEPSLGEIQSALFDVGAELATVDARALEGLKRVGDADVARLESWIDALDRDLPPLTTFVLPGGPSLAAQLHVARVVCRRAERRVVALRQEGSVADTVVRYLNRLADLLFVQARACNRRANVTETPWRGGRKA